MNLIEATKRLEVLLSGDLAEDKIKQEVKIFSEKYTNTPVIFSDNWLHWHAKTIVDRIKNA